MIIAPLVFSTLVAGIAHMGDSAALGRIERLSIPLPPPQQLRERQAGCQLLAHRPGLGKVVGWAIKVNRVNRHGGTETGRQLVDRRPPGLKIRHHLHSDF